MARKADEILTADQVAEATGLSAQMVRDYCRRDAFPGARRLGRAWIIPRSALKKFKRNDLGRPRT